MIGQHGAAEFDAVGALDHQRQRAAGDGIALPVAQERCEVHGLIGAIDAALGVDEGIRAHRDFPAFDAAIAQVKRARFQAEESVVGLLAGDGQHCRRQAALAARQPRLEQHVPRVIRLARGEDFIVARDQPHFGACDRIRRSQRIDEHMNAVIA